MKKIINIALVSLMFFSSVGCYSKFESPAPAQPYTDADFADAEIISIKALKEKYSSLVGTSKSEQITEDLVIRGKVISSDREGNIYKSLFILDHDDVDGSAAIELRLFASNYVCYPVGSMVYVRLNELSIGDYKGMLSIGARSVNEDYVHTTIENRLALDAHIFLGEQLAMTSADTIVITKDNYSTLSDDNLACLVRFEGVESVWGSAAWGYKNYYPNYFSSAENNFEWSESYGETFPDLAVPTLAYYGSNPDNSSLADSYFYGSSWYSYDPTGTDNESGQYVIRLSAYARFSKTEVPAEGSKVNITSIYTQFGSGSTKAYQLTLSYGSDIEIVEE